MTPNNNVFKIVDRNGWLHLEQHQRASKGSPWAMRPILRFNREALNDPSFPDRVFDEIAALQDPNLPSGWATWPISIPAPGLGWSTSAVDLTRALHDRFDRLAAPGGRHRLCPVVEALAHALGWDAAEFDRRWMRIRMQDDALADPVRPMSPDRLT